MTHPQYRISDAAKRISDTFMLHRAADLQGSLGKWFAVRLTDGTSDGVAYDTKRQAVTHQHNDEMYYWFIRIVPGGMSPTEAQAGLETQRRMFDKGIVMADPDHVAGGRDMIKRLTQEDQYRQLRALFIGDAPPSNIVHGGQ